MENKTVVVEIPNTKKEMRKALIKTLDTVIRYKDTINKMEAGLIKQDKTITDLKATITEQDEMLLSHFPLAHEYVKEHINKDIAKDMPCCQKH